MRGCAKSLSAITLPSAFLREWRNSRCGDSSLRQSAPLYRKQLQYVDHSCA